MVYFGFAPLALVVGDEILDEFDAVGGDGGDRFADGGAGAGDEGAGDVFGLVLVAE